MVWHTENYKEKNYRFLTQFLILSFSDLLFSMSRILLIIVVSMVVLESVSSECVPHKQHHPEEVLVQCDDKKEIFIKKIILSNKNIMFQVKVKCNGQFDNFQFPTLKGKFCRDNDVYTIRQPAYFNPLIRYRTNLSSFSTYYQLWDWYWYVILFLKTVRNVSCI